MTLHSPIWLILLIPLGASWWWWRLPSRLLRCLRCVLVVLVLLALSGLAVQLPSRTGTIIVVADRSLSMPSGSEAAQKEAIDLIQGAMDSDDRLAVVTFGQRIAVEQPPQAGKFGGFVNEVGADASNLAEGLETALALIPRDSPGKVIVLSDGRWTGRNPTIVAGRAAARDIAIDFRMLQRPFANDLAIARTDAPSAVNSGESFMITAWVQAPVAQDVSFELRRGGKPLSAGKRRLTAGLNRLTFRDQAAEPGTQSYTLTVTGRGDDPVPENNRARILVGVQGPRPLLYVTQSPRSALPRLLQVGGLKLKVASPETCDWTLEELSKYAGVVLENVAAEKIGTAGMETLAAWVQETGAGLMVTGGRSAYGPGGYYRSPLEPIFPVSMELRNEHRKLALAIVVTLDRSGSMAMSIGGGKCKMDLANLGTVQVLDLLGTMDEFGVIAVDTEPHIVADLAPVINKERVRKDVLGIQSMGGGIYIYVALEAALKMIQPAKAGTKHIILFSDAADAEEPRTYEELVERCRKADVTVSVIGLGTERDKDAELLRDIARRGGGRVFFSDKPEELPRLFAQDTFVVARSTFLDEPTPVQALPGLVTMTGKRFDMKQAIGGYNLCYLRPEATLAAVTEDEYKAPLVVAWQAGVGRVLCYTGEADGKHTGAIARWNEVGDFFTSLARWTTGQTGPSAGNMLLTQEVKHGVNEVQLHLDPERQSDPFSGLPQVRALSALPGQKPEARKLEMRWTSADTLAAIVPLQGSETSLATLDIPGQLPVALSPVCLPYSPEFKPVENDLGQVTLARLAKATGGKERVELAGIWKDLPKHPRMIPLGSWLLVTATILLLLEVLERRTGLLAQQSRRLTWNLGQQIAARKRWLFWKRPRSVATVESPPAGPKAPGPLKAASPRSESTQKEGMLEALRQARHRTKR